MLADRPHRFVVAVNALRSRIPGDNPSVGIQQKQRIVLHPGRNLIVGGLEPRFARPYRACPSSGLVTQDQNVAHGQHVPFGGVLNFPRTSVRAHQLQRALLLAFFEKACQSSEITGLKLGSANSSRLRPMIFSRGRPSSLPAPTLASR